MLTKSKLKQHLKDIGIKTYGNYIKKSDVTRIATAGDVVQFPTKKYEWGFDLTSIKPSIWKKILKLIEAKETPEHDEYSWVWKGKDVSLYTGNDPISGEYASKGRRRENEIGYASYIGIEGKKDLVEKVADLIKKHADYIKDESPGERQFI